MNLPSQTMGREEHPGVIQDAWNKLFSEHDVLINLISFKVGDAYNYQAYWKHLPTGTYRHVKDGHDVNALDMRRIKTFESPWTALAEAIDAAHNWLAASGS